MWRNHAIVSILRKRGESGCFGLRLHKRGSFSRLPGSACHSLYLRNDRNIQSRRQRIFPEVSILRRQLFARLGQPGRLRSGREDTRGQLHHECLLRQPRRGGIRQALLPGRVGRSRTLPREYTGRNKLHAGQREGDGRILRCLQEILCRLCHHRTRGRGRLCKVRERGDPRRLCEARQDNHTDLSEETERHRIDLRTGRYRECATASALPHQTRYCRQCRG